MPSLPRLELSRNAQVKIGETVPRKRTMRERLSHFLFVTWILVPVDTLESFENLPGTKGGH